MTVYHNFTEKYVVCVSSYYVVGEAIENYLNILHNLRNDTLEFEYR